MLRYRFGLILAGCLVSLTPAWGERGSEDLPIPGEIPASTKPLMFKVEKLGDVDDEFIKHVEELLQKIPPHLRREVIQAGIRVFVARDMHLESPQYQESISDSTAFYDTEWGRQRIVIDRSRFVEFEGTYYQLAKDAKRTERTERSLGAVVAHEFGHAYDWAPTYDKRHPREIRSSAAPFASALSNDQKRVVVPQSNVNEQASPYNTYLDHFRGVAETTRVAPPDPLRETYAEAIAIHLALYLDYAPERAQRFFSHSFPNVMEHVRRVVFPEQGCCSEEVVQGMQQRMPPRTTKPGQPQIAKIVNRIPNIGSVHEFDHPPLAYIFGKEVRIRGTRFEVDVIGLDPVVEYRLLACFDGETIGDTDWFSHRDSYSIPTQVGFPPGRYRLTVQAFQRVGGSAMQTPPVSIYYQPTYLREMIHHAGHDVTAVTSHLAISHGRFGDVKSERGKTQVHFSGLADRRFYTYSTSAEAFDLEPYVIPARLNFEQGRVHRLKFEIDDGMEVYATLEIPSAPARANAFLAQNAVQLKLEEEALENVLAGTMLTMVMYLPYRAASEEGTLCVETEVSHCPGDCKNPLVEATRLGTVLAILHFGEKDLWSKQYPTVQQRAVPNPRVLENHSATTSTAQ